MNTSRHFGPFSGAQLTLLILTFMFVVGFPFAAFAVSSVVVQRADTSSTYLKTPVQVTACVSNQCPTIAKVSSAHALVITSIHLAVALNNNPGPFDGVVIERSSDGSCKGTTLEEKTRQIVTPTGIQELDLPYPSGLTIPAGRALCAFSNSNPSNFGAFASVYGYSTAPSAVPAS